MIAGKYAVSRRDTLMVLIPMLHRDPKVWGDDVEAFRPERFAPEAMEKLPPNAWKPFGNGQRACIGRPFAMQEAQLLMSMILQRFDLIEDDPSYQLTVAETLTLKPQGFRIRVKRRGRRLVQAAQRGAAGAAKPVGAARRRRRARRPGRRRRCSCSTARTPARPRPSRERIASDAEAQGYAAVAAPLDEHAGALPTDGAVVHRDRVVRGPAARQRAPVRGLARIARARRAEGRALRGVRLRQPPMGAHLPGGAEALRRRARGGRRDAHQGARRGRCAAATSSARSTSGTAALWSDLGRALGKEVQAAPTGGQLQVEVVKAGRTAILRLGDLEHGEVVENRELVDMASPLGRSKRHIDIALPEGMTYRAGDYLAVLPHNPIGVVMRALKRFDLASDSQVVITQAGEQHHVAAGRLPGQRQRAAVPLRRAGAAGDARAGRARWPPRRAARPRRPSSTRSPRRARTSARCSASA